MSSVVRALRCQNSHCLERQVFTEEVMAFVRGGASSTPPPATVGFSKSLRHLKSMSRAFTA